jgi:hypothetical protein
MEQSLSEVHVVQGLTVAPLELLPLELLLLLLLLLELVLPLPPLLLLPPKFGVEGTSQPIGIGSSMTSGVTIEASSFALDSAQSPWVIACPVPQAAAAATTKTQACTIPRALILMLPFLAFVFRSDSPENHTRI